MISSPCKKCGGGPILGPNYEEKEDKLLYRCAVCGYYFYKDCADSAADQAAYRAVDYARKRFGDDEQKVFIAASSFGDAVEWSQKNDVSLIDRAIEYYEAEANGWRQSGFGPDDAILSADDVIGCLLRIKKEAHGD